MSNESWVLYDPNQNAQTDKLSTEQAQFSLMKMKTKEINNFLIWRSDWQKWKKLKEFLTSDQSPFMSTFLQKAPTRDSEDNSSTSTIKMKPVDKETEKIIKASFSSVQLEEVKLSELTGVGHSQFDGDALSTENTNVNADLNFKNLDKNPFSKSNKDDKYKLELLLIHPKGSMFRTIAKDISLSGTFCERIVPDEFHHSSFDLVVINNFISDSRHNRLTLKAKVLITDSSIYLEYISPTAQQKETLRAILDYYIRSTQKINS